MRVHVLSLFPLMFKGVLGESILRIAQDKGALEVTCHDLRAYTTDKHGKVDDEPYGGGPGMVLCCQPVADAVDDLTARFGPCHLVMLTPQGQPFTQARAHQLVQHEQLVLLCGRYEGFDERVRLLFEWDEVSIGDYVLSGGEIPAMAVIDALARLLPGVLGDAESARQESFEDGLLDFPQYTRPPEFRGLSVPGVLRSGHHEAVAQWRRRQRELRTKQRRPDWWMKYRHRHEHDDVPGGKFDDSKDTP